MELTSKSSKIAKLRNKAEKALSIFSKTVVELESANEGMSEIAFKNTQDILELKEENVGLIKSMEQNTSVIHKIKSIIG